MKIAIITDTHFGDRSDAVQHLDHQQKFYDEVFFPYLKQHQLTTVFHLGDLVDRRKYINYNTAKRMREMFLEPLKGFDVHLLLGNHDIAMKNTHEINALRELVIDRYPNIRVYEQIETIMLADQSICMVPWITPELRENVIKVISTDISRYCFGHLELQGFLGNGGVELAHADDPSLFARYELVCSGHFHTRNTKDNIAYLGSPYQATWSDYGNVTKGFHTLDLQSGQLTFVENPHTQFVKLYYNDVNRSLEQMMDAAEAAEISGCYVRVEVDDKSNAYKFDLYMQHLESLHPYDLKVIDKKSIVFFNDVDTTQNTKEILKKSVDEADVTVDKDKLSQLILNLYDEANKTEL